MSGACRRRLLVGAGKVSVQDKHVYTGCATVLGSASVESAPFCRGLREGAVQTCLCTFRLRAQAGQVAGPGAMLSRRRALCPDKTVHVAGFAGSSARWWEVAWILGAIAVRQTGECCLACLLMSFCIAHCSPAPGWLRARAVLQQ